MRYKVLWIDDMFKTQEDFIGEAEQEYIDVYPYESHEEGIARLNSDPEFFHAVILDAKVKKGKDDTDTGLAGLSASRDRLIEINKNGYLPFFIFTGQPDYVDASWFTETFGKYYIKAKDNELLFKDLKNAIDKKIEYQIQKKYQSAFEVCTDKYIGAPAIKHFFDILTSIEHPADQFDDEKYFNGLRKIIEYVFRASNKLGLLHDKCIPNGIVNLTWSSLFMALKEMELGSSGEKIGCSKIHFPCILASNVKSILDITSAASHTEGEKENGKLNFTQYKTQINSNYLLYSLAFQVMDLVLWFKKYADEHPDSKINKAQWMPLDKDLGDWQTGKVVNLNSAKGFAFFKPDTGNASTFIPPTLVTKNSLLDNTLVTVIIENYEDKNKETKTRVKELRRL
ncbi:MAG: hypothetical protein ABIN36_16160 [Ferruginibacter sp.]